MISVVAWIGTALAVPNWAMERPAIEAGSATAIVVRVLNAEQGQAPMVHLTLGSQSHQLGCADDGSFPDTAADDGVFHCGHLVEPASVTETDFSARFSIRGGSGEDQVLGAFQYEPGGGYRYATLTIGNADAGSAAPFSLAPAGSPSSAADSAPTQSSPASAPPASPTPPSGPGGSAGAGLPAWGWVVVAAGVGWLAGRRGRREKEPPADATRVLPCEPIDGRGPQPPRPAFIAATDASAATRRVVQSVSASRRVVLVGSVPADLRVTGHDVMPCADPDPIGIATAVDQLRRDGGVPPVVVVVGRDALVDTSGVSTDARVDLIGAVAEAAWVIFIGEALGSPVDGADAWSHDPQAGWSRG
ncbi:MAG: hypothetical protein VX944_16750 [Myxococcota bacterium]|nr:hypothetical protein [Myxococcota bacterium]